MQPARIAALLEPFLGESNEQRLTAANLECISIYIDILLRWNARMNLTAIRDPEEIVTRHFGESLFAARHLFPDRSAGTAVSGRPTESSSASIPHRVSVADVGSGAGFPGLPIKIWAPGIALTLIESSHKKAAFLREVARALTLSGVAVETSRAETLAPGAFDLVTLRAVERFDVVLPTAARLVAPPGRLALLIGRSQLSRAQSLLPAARQNPLTWLDPEPIPGSRGRVLEIATY